MTSEHGATTPTQAAPIVGALEVLTTRYDIRKVRFAQLLVPLAAIVTPFARRSMSPIAIAVSVLLSGGATWNFVTAKTRKSATIRLRNGKLNIDHETIRSGEGGLWRWQGDRARRSACAWR